MTSPPEKSLQPILIPNRDSGSSSGSPGLFSLCIIWIVAGVAALCGCSKSSPTGGTSGTHVVTPMGVEVAAEPHGVSKEDFKRLMDTLKSNNIPFNMVGDPSGYHAFVPPDRYDAAHEVLKREQQNGLNVTLK